MKIDKPEDLKGILHIETHLIGSSNGGKIEGVARPERFELPAF